MHFLGGGLDTAAWLEQLSLDFIVIVRTELNSWYVGTRRAL